MQGANIFAYNWLTFSVRLYRVTGIVFAAVVAELCHFSDRFQTFLPALMSFSVVVKWRLVCMVHTIQE